MTVDQIKYIVASRLNRDTDEEYVESLVPLIYGLRSRLIRQQFQKYESQIYFERSFNVGLELASEYDNCGLESDCSVMRTTMTIPTPVRFEYRPVFNRVADADKRHTLSFTTPEQYEYLRNLIGTNERDLWYFWINNRIVIPNNKLIKEINVRGVFARPDQLVKFNCTNCLDTEVDIQEDIAMTIVEVLLNENRLQLPDVNNGQLKT
jgi:hypothetical protein